MAGIVLGKKNPFVPDLPKAPEEDLADKLTDGGFLADTQFGKGIDAGIDQTQGLGGALKATVGSAIGNEEWVESGLAYYRQKMQDAANVGANVTSVEEIDSFGDFTDWAGYTLGTLVPDVLGGGVAGVAAKSGARKLLKKKLEQEADTIGKRLAEKAVQKNYDAAAGFVGYSAAQNTASNFAEIYEETGIEAPGKALAVGTAQGALDQFGVPQRAFKRMFGSEGLQQFNDEIAERVFMSKDYIYSVGREAFKAAGVEGFTEATQEFLGRAAVAWAEESLPPEQQREFMEIVADERSKSMYINAFAAGSLAGLVGGGAIEATRFGGGNRESDPEGGQQFSEDEEQARINRMPEARRKVIELTQAETTIDTEAGPSPEPTPGTVALSPEETTIQPGQDESMDILLEGYERPPAEPQIYWGNMPVPLQKQLIVDGVEDDITTEANLRAAAEKLDGQARTSALNAIDASTSRNTRRAVPKATQQTDEFSGDIFMVSTPQTLAEKIDTFNDAAQRGPVPKPTGEGEFVSQGVTEADINFNITPAQRPVFMGTEDGRTVQLPGLTDFVGSTDPTANPALEEAASIYLDLAMRGMPKEFRDLVKGTHVLSTEDIPHDADAAFLDRSSVIGMRFDHLIEGANDEQRARRNRFNTAHEMMHAADFKNGYSSLIDHFKMTVEDIDGDGQPDINMGRAIEEIFDLWESDGEASGFFAYPLDSLYENIAKQNGDPEKIQSVLDGAREELFAQLGAAYVANEGSIQKSLPFGHSIIEDIFANPVPAEQLVTNDTRGLYGNQEAIQEAPVSEGAGVPRDIRTPAESGGVQVQDEGGAGGTSGPSPVEEQASESVGGTPEPEAGDSAGQVLPVEIESVKRAEDFSLNGTMNVTMADGDVYQISRDPVARGWVLDPQHHEEFNLGQFHPFTVGTFADNRKEAEATLARLHNEKLERNAPAAEPAPRQELRDNLLQNIPEDGISAAQLSEQVGQEEGNFRDLLDQMEEDGEIISDLTPDGERYFPASSDPKFIKKGAEYLLQNSRGKTTGKASVTKAINPKNAAKQIPALQALSDRHDDALSSPAAWLKFERDLTGSNTTIRPPHGLISLYNDMDTWVATHSRLSDQQVQAAREGLETAREMGEVYASGEATPDITAKLMLWGIMSRMLTASAQEAGFVDLLTKMPGAKDDPAGDIIQKTLDGTITEKDVKGWEKAVKRLIPEGSFGRSGTSNANDWAKFMLKMSERAEDGRSRLEELHDLVGNRSISTVDVRRQFQGMINNPGIGNKVFSFLMLMTGRDDVVILDRIQLNSMWDAGRYGKLIYDDIADEFDKGHGLARYEALEKSLNQRIKELYRRLGREEEGSVGRYHWESWVLNSGQVVAHPTMKGLLDDARGEDTPYADMGAPEGKMNLFRYGAIYARDPDGKPYFLYADQSNKPYRFTPAKFSEFLDQIKLRKRNIIPKGFKVSEYDKGFPWYEADGVNRDNLDALIREYAEREAVESDYAVEEADVQDDTNVSGQPEAERPRFIKRKEPAPAAFRDEDLRAVARESAVREFEYSGIEPGESVADIDIDELTIPPTFRRLMKALERDDYLGFDRIDDAMIAVFDDDIDDYDPSPGLKSAIGRYINDTMGENGPIVPVSNKTIPKVASAYKRLRRGEIEIDEYLRVVGSTVKPYTSVPDPASVEEMRGALQANQKDLIDVPINEGAEVGLRLDIPAYDRHNVWVPTIHEKTTKSHRSTARVVGATFKASPNTSRKIMEGDMSKVTYARIMGGFVNKTAEENYNDAVAALNDPAWIQVGMDPRRREGFYNRKTMEPIVSADEVIQVGPLVLAKGAVTGDINKVSYHRRQEQEDAHNISFNLDDEYLVEKDLDQRLNRLVPGGFRRTFVDRYERLHELENRIAAKLGLDRLPASVSAYDAENLMHSKVQEQITQFEEKYIKKIADKMREASLDADQVGLYLIAKHAPERNRVIAAREREMRQEQIDRLNKALEDSMGALDRPSPEIVERLDRLENEPLKFQETGSGMTDADAESVIAKAKLEDKYDALEAVAADVYTMLSDMRENMVAKGLLDDDTREDWEDTYEFYVPLKGFAAIEADGQMQAGSAKGFTIKGKESFRAKGRITLPANPLLNAFKDGETKIIRAERNVIAQRLLKMLGKFKSDQWSVYPPTQYPFKAPPDDISVRKSRSEMANEKRPDDSNVNRYIQVKRNGQDHFIEIRDAELNRQLQSGGVGVFNQDIEHFGQLMTRMRKFQNFRRDMIINYNPSWGLVNPIRDLQTGLAYVLAEQGSRAGRLKDKELVGKIAKGWGASWGALWRDSRGIDPKTDKQRELAQFAREYKEDGAPTGIAYSRSLDEQARRIESLIKRGKVKEAFSYAGKLVEDFNQVMENVTRFSTYVEARKAGVERTSAATVAKDLTVNFNRKGDVASSMDTFYLFFNAAIQGNVNTAKAALRSGRDGEIFTKARYVAAGMVLAGFARAMFNIWRAGEDEDGESKYLDFSEYTQKTGMLFIIDDEQGASLPKTYGWGFYDDVGRLGAELAMGIKGPDQVAIDMFTSMDRHFNPQGIHAVSDDRDAVEAMMLKGMFFIFPDVLDAGLEQVANINYFGENITIPPSPFGAKTPRSQKTRRGTSDFIEDITTTIAEATGGSEYVSGTFEVNPDRVQHGLDFMLGGVGRFFNDLGDTAVKAMNDRPGDLKSDDLPILRSFLPRASEYKDRITYYDSRDEWLQYREEINNVPPEEKRALVERYGKEFYAFDTFHKTAEKNLRKLGKAKNQLEENDLMDPIIRYQRLDAIAEQQDKIFDAYNKRWNEIKP